MQTDNEIQRNITAELRWEPSLRNDDIAVAIRDGVVTLAGFVDSYADKRKAEEVVGNVRGVRALANDLEVKLPSDAQRSDPDIARAALDALKWNITVPQDRIKVRVEQGWLTLEGEVEWYFQRHAAERAVRYIRGAKGVTNLIVVQARPATSDVKQRIKEALQRGARVDADHITLDVNGHTVTLRGTVHTYAEKLDAERAARNAPGVTEVVNDITVDPFVHATV
jgi:osmotically-inducible protein OsmY